MATQDLIQSPLTNRSRALPRRSGAQLPKASFPEDKPSTAGAARASTKASLQLKRPRTIKKQNGPLTSHQRQYQKRRANGLCTATGCPKKSAPGHAHCREHLRLMSRQNKKRYTARAREQLCVYCGERPGFWGVRCIICRQRFYKDPLPYAARRALHSYQEIEKKRDIEHARVEARFQARKLLLTDQLTAAQAKALRLLVGDDTWRTYDEVARLMRVSKQRVHQMLLVTREAWDTDTRKSTRRQRQPHDSKRATRQQTAYRKRRAEGLCGYGRCPEPAVPGQSQCGSHLQAMLDRAVKRREERKRQKLCVACGKLPQFWGKRCILCRQLFSKDPLPGALKRALRQHRQAEAKRESEKDYHQLREAAALVLARGVVTGKSAEALRLWVGLDRNKSRSYRAVGDLMGLSGERVRQLLVGPKQLLAPRLSIESSPTQPQSLNTNSAEKRLQPSWVIG